uniref:Uncharacterized protein n=1 Tax=viral metagenome TaxID=1070528 RepID=A0A6M3J594_9ZZZZ
MRDNLTIEELNKAIEILTALKDKDIPIRFDVSPAVNRLLKHRTSLYQEPSPATTLGYYTGIPVFVDEEMPYNLIRLVYPDRTEVKIFNLDCRASAPGVKE